MEVSPIFICCLALGVLVPVVRGQHRSGFISIDCGIAEGSEYEDDTSNIPYTSDLQYIDTGVNGDISEDYKSKNVMRQLFTVRTFPEGINNCYTLKPPQARGNNFLIRALFMYGNHDSKDQPPEFALYLEGDEWDIIRLSNATDEIVIKEIIHVPITDYIHVCLVNIGAGTPFISALELRQLNNSIYKADQSSSLALQLRADLGSTRSNIFRCPDDAYDRLWGSYTQLNWKAIESSYSGELLSANEYEPPASVMMTAVIPSNGSKSLDFVYEHRYNSTQRFHFYMHFAGIENLQANQLRKFGLSYNGDSWDQPVVLNPLLPYTFNTRSISGSPLRFSVYVTNDSTLPPILNALEIYMVKEFSQSPTDQNDVDAIRNIKSVYRVKRNWQGDPCAPTMYSWDGLICSYHAADNSFVIVSLNLSLSGLTGNVDPSFFHLKSLKCLDLSNNGLTGPVPAFLSQLPLLEALDLSGNKFSGSLPSSLVEKSNDGSLILRTDGNPNLCQRISCKKKKITIVIIVVATTAASFLVFFTVLMILRCLSSRIRQEFTLRPRKEDQTLERKKRQFTYNEVLTITNNFRKELGRGGFGAVYEGSMEDGTQVAVKMLSSSSTQGLKQFQSEVQLLTKVHHRNLVSLIGYCNEGEKMGLLYECMSNGNLKEHLSERSPTFLSWEQRLHIAVDAAHALEYLHNGCKPPIIHRDVKTPNILLNEKLQAKVSDFGLSRFMPLESGTHVSTAAVGTPGYLDPEYYVTNRLNEKSDVFSFGIVLLELVTGQPAVLKSGNDMINIVQWVQPIIERGEVKKLVDSRLQGDYDTNCVWKVVETAMSCTQPSSIQRPTICQVLVELKGCLDTEKVTETSLRVEDLMPKSNASIATVADSSMVPYAR